MKDFHNVFSYYDKSKPKEIECQTNYIFLFHAMWFKIYLCKTNVHHKVLKNEKMLKKTSTIILLQFALRII
jgi:hypothetical protein